jgi:uroporphyrin-III C-methyltransferase
MNKGSLVCIVGAGPGDPDLLSVKAARVLQKADVVVYDRLVSEEVLSVIPSETPRIFAGKASRKHHMPQEEINALLVDLAKKNDLVVRLKGGDPFVFGRGSEEALYLAENGVAFEIVPGISASAGCAAYAGIPLTHRGLAKSVRFVTGHCQDGSELDLDWDGLADTDTTLVVYMGLANARKISERLIDAGLPADMPVVAIHKGTTPQQKTMTTTLSALADDLQQGGFIAPTLIIIGKVAALAEHISWYACDNGLSEKE